MIPLHWHSSYSLLDASASIEDIISKAQQLNLPAIALTDYWWMYGVIDFYTSAKKNNINPLIGVDLPLVQTISSTPSKNWEPKFATFLAKNYEGYLELLRLTTYANTEGVFNDIPRVDFKQLASLKNVYLIVGSHNSVLGDLILSWGSLDQAEDLLSQLSELIGSQNLLIEFNIQDFKKLPVFKILRETLQKLQKVGMPIISSNYHYVNQSQKEAFLASLEIKYGAGNIPHIFKYGDFYILSQKEVLELAKANQLDLGFVKQLIHNTTQIADQINIDIPMGQILFPDYRPSPTTQELYSKYQDQLDVE